MERLSKPRTTPDLDGHAPAPGIRRFSFVVVDGSPLIVKGTVNVKRKT
jgi:hypothetical protein